MTALSNNDIDSTGLSSFLVKHLGSDISVFRLAGDASARRYYRVVRDEESFVLMQWEPFKTLSDYPFTNIGMHLGAHGVLVPETIASSPEEGFLLLEDLGDLTLERKFWESQNQEHSLGFYKQAIEQLGLIHYPSTADRNNACIAFDIAFDTDKFLWELNYTRKNLIEGVCKLKLSDKDSLQLDKLFLDIASKLHEEDKFVSHRDYHSRNLMIKLGKLRVIDYQDARMGPIQYDLVSLLKDSYVRLNPEMEESLLNYYLDIRSNYMTTHLNRDQFQEIYQLQTIQRCFKACGSFASFFETREDRRYLKYLSYTLGVVDSALTNFPEYSFLQDFLKNEGVLEKDFASL